MKIFLLPKEGYSGRVTSSYLLVCPLLAENRAISLYVQGTRDPNRRAILPEVVSVKEAVALATREMMLNPTEQAQLSALLTRYLMNPEA